MLTIQQKAQCVLWYHKLKSLTAVQRKFRNEFGQDPLHTNSIKRWFKNFMETGSILDHKRLGRPSIDKETVDAVHVAFHCSPRNHFMLHEMNLLFLKVQFTKLYINDFDSMLTSYKLFKLLSWMITLAEQLQRIDNDNDYLNSVVFLTKQLFMYLGKSISITFKYWDQKILVRL